MAEKHARDSHIYLFVNKNECFSLSYVLYLVFGLTVTNNNVFLLNISIWTHRIIFMSAHLRIAKKAEQKISD